MSRPPKSGAPTAPITVARGFWAGVVAGLAAIAAMYLLTAIAALTPLPQLLQDLVIGLVPGPLFGLLIDRLQHAAIVTEEAGLLVACLVVAGVLGSAYFLARRWTGRGLAVAFGAAVWALICLVLLPVNNAGLLGIRDSVFTPLFWALVAFVFGLTLELTYHDLVVLPASDSQAAPGRRRFIALATVGIAGISLSYVLLRLGPRWIRLITAPPENVSAGALTTPLTPADDFYVVSKDFLDPVVSAEQWALKVQGLVDKPFALPLRDLMQLPSSENDITLECISNPVGGRLISTAHFKGVALQLLLEMAGVQLRAASVAFVCRDDYKELVPLDFIKATPGIVVAYEMNSSPLQASHGFPARLVIPGHYGMKSPKWLDTIELTTDVTGAYYEMLGWGWQDQAVVRTMSRFDIPGDGSVRHLGPIPLGGLAFGGSRGISKVEFSPDGGRNWQPAELEPPMSNFAWVLWTATWLPLDARRYTLQVRAFDGTGEAQPRGDEPSFPDGASGYHTISVTVH